MKKLHRRGVILVALLFLSVMSCRMAYGIDLINVLKVPDDGFGSVVLGIYSMTGGGLLGLTGEIKDPAGRSLPVIWNVPDVVVIANLIRLPVQPGFEGRALGGAVFSNGDIAIVGNVFTQETTHAVLWRKSLAGNWSLPIRLSGNAPQSLLRGYQSQGYQTQGFLAAVGSVQIDGVWKPIVYEISQNDIQSELLPIPSSASGRATGIDIDIPAGRSISGSVENQAGVTRAVVWIHRGNGWATFPVDTPRNANSQANSVVLREAGYSVSGELFQSARARGFFADSAGNFNLLAPLEGYENSSALRHTEPPGGGAGGPLNVIVTGTSWNPGGLPVATQWMNGQAFPAQQRLLDPDAVADVTAFKPGESPTINVGQVIDSNSHRQGAVFLSSTINVPDQLGILAGRFGEGKLTGLWHTTDAGLGLSIRPQLLDGERRASAVILIYDPVCGCVGATYTNTIVARAESNGAGATGTLNIYQHNQTDLEFLLVQSRVITDTNQTITFTLPSGDQWRNPITGQLQMRLDFTPDGSRPAALVLESVQINHQ